MGQSSGLRITRIPHSRPSPAGLTRGSIVFGHTRELAEGMDCRLEAIESGNDGRGARPKSAVADLGSHRLWAVIPADLGQTRDRWLGAYSAASSFSPPSSPA